MPSAWRPPMPLAVLLAVLFLGTARYQAAQLAPTLDQVGWRNDSGEVWIIEGVVVEPPVVEDMTARLVVSAERLLASETQIFSEVGGKLLASVPAAGDWRYGDRIRLEGYLATPFVTEDFSYKQVLARRGITSTMNRPKAFRIGSRAGNPILVAIYNLKDHSSQLTYRLWPDPEASLLTGILLGDEAGISDSVQQAFKDTGTLHIIAISGYNIPLTQNALLSNHQ